MNLLILWLGLERQLLLLLLLREEVEQDRDRDREEGHRSSMNRYTVICACARTYSEAIREARFGKSGVIATRPENGSY